MDKRVIEKFLKNNPFDEIFYYQISLGTLMINANGLDFKKAENLDLLKKVFGEGVK